MARYLALEWDDSEARVAVAKPRGADISVEYAFAVDLKGNETESAGDLIAAALESRGLTKVDSIVGVGRSSIELRLLQLPAAPPEEMPEMVRFQAMRQFAAIGEEWPLDFTEVSATAAEDDTTSVLAAAISPELVDQVSEVCGPSQLQPQRIILRPFAAASLLRRRAGAERECRLIVDFLTDEADLTVLSRGEVAFMRTVRVPTTDDKQAVARAILGEIRRTIGAAQNQLGGQRVEKLTVFGSGEEHAVLKAEAEQQLALEVSLFDPFDQVHLSGSLSESLPDNHGRFAPLLGMLTDELTGVRHAIDFLNPRRRPKPPSKARQNSIIGVGAVAVVVALIAMAMFSSWQRSREITQLMEKRDNLKKQIDSRKEWKRDRNEIDRFLTHDVNWLDEVYRVAEQLPNRDDVMVDHINFRLNREVGGGIVNIKMHVRDNDLVRKYEKRLADKFRSVSDYGMSIDPKRPDHPWTLIQRIETTWNRINQMSAVAAKSSSPGDKKQPSSDTQPKKGTPGDPKKAAPKITSTTKK